MQAKRWILNQCAKEQTEKMSRALGVSPYIAEILLKRGIKSYEQAQEFLNPSLEHLSEPLGILNMGAAAEKIWQAIDAEKKITVYGDYDVDGMCATAILYEGLKDLGARADVYVPDRIEEGYGLNEKAIESIYAAGSELLVTVDCGISSAKETAKAKKLGLDVIVTDHHQLPEELPRTIIVNPALGAEKGAKWADLCGAGVSFKLVQALYEWRYGQESVWKNTEKLLDLAALATIADIVPLRGDNRIIVKFGLEVLARGQRAGLRELARVAVGNNNVEINTVLASFGLAPRLNACGRIGDVHTGLELLLTADKNKAWAIAKRLDEENRDRQNIERQIFEEALLSVTEKGMDAHRGIIVCGDNWHPGVIGIVASRIAERFYTPVIVFTQNNGLYKGSGRSIEGFHLQQALAKCADILESFGGHAQAAGLSIKAENMDEFIRRFGDLVAESDEQIFLPRVKIDCVLNQTAINYGFYNELAKLQPFGMNNPPPIFALRGLKAGESRAVGANCDHLKVKFLTAKGDINAIGFKKAYLEDTLKHELVDVAFNLEKNVFNGHSSLQLNICDIKSKRRSDDLNMLDKLFFYWEDYLQDDPYRNIAAKDEFYTKIVGVSFENRQDIISGLKAGQELVLRREKENAYDENAVAVYWQEKHLGYLKRELAGHLAPCLDRKTVYTASVSQITGQDKNNLGVNIFIRREKEFSCVDEKNLLTKRKAEYQALSAEEQKSLIKRQVLGGNDYRTKQKESLEALEENKNVFCIMGTGRGKSAIFQSYSAYLALNRHKRTVIIYPLRALVNDQYNRLTAALTDLGLDTLKATGEITAEERAEIYRKLKNNEADVILTTPEFFCCNQNTIFAEANIGFIVIDEAHHLTDRRSGYKSLLNILKRFQGQILALTATMPEEAWQKVKENLKFDCLIIDEHVRENLILDDCRGTKEKITWLEELLAQDEKTIVYVNSRRKAVEIAQALRDRCQDEKLRSKICYYHGGLEAGDRKLIEKDFREGILSFIISTSAFGEGIDIGDIKHVVLYHLSFSLEEYNQLAGRAGRNGNEAYIHLLYNERDKNLNELLLSENCPSREMLVGFYKALRALGRKGAITLTNAQLAQSTKGVKNISENAVSHWLGIFEELNFLSRETNGSKRTIIINEKPSKTDLEESLRYTEGVAEMAEYEKYAELAFSKDSASLLKAINRPIFPQTETINKGGE